MFEYVDVLRVKLFETYRTRRQPERDDGEMHFGQKSHSTGQARIYHGSLTGSMLVCWWWWFDWSFARLIAPVVSCHNQIHHPLLQWTPANPGSPGKWPLKRREREREREREKYPINPCLSMTFSDLERRDAWRPIKPDVRRCLLDQRILA